MIRQVLSAVAAAGRDAHHILTSEFGCGRRWTAAACHALAAAKPVSNGPASRIDIAARHWHACRCHAAIEGAELPDRGGTPDYTDDGQGGASP